MSRPTSVDVPVRSLTRGMRALLLVAAVLVFLAGVQLFVFTERTERYFAWTIDPPLTAAFLGASYWASVTFEWKAARARSWAAARIAVPTVFVFTTLTLVVTLVHLDKFHLGDEHEAATRAVTWAWIGVYVVVPVLMAVVWVRQHRLPGADQPRAGALPTWLVALVAAQAALLVVLGVALLVDPEAAAGVWPWPLTALTGRAIGAWATSLGVAAAHALWERDPARLQPAAAAYLVFGALQAVALLRYPDTLSWAEPEALGYVAFLASTIVTGVAALHAGSGETPATAARGAVPAAAEVRPHLPEG